MTHDTGSERGLPELPDALAQVAQFHGEWRETASHGAQPIYSEDDMHAYAIAAIEKDRAERSEAVPVDALIALLPGPYYMDPPDGGSVTVLEQLQRMSEDAAKWRNTAPPERSDVQGAESLARQFHEAYERLAPKFHYATRPASRMFDPKSSNGQLMIAVCTELLASRPAVQQEGWVMVPRESTSAMDEAGMRSLMFEHAQQRDAYLCWDAMIAAAPPAAASPR